ncbi:MAG: hypothetical protein OEZ59_00110 [Deltaproteobacteria bacterium]|nr:hypothetical protein [Deltaproteobacteria bacterium]
MRAWFIRGAFGFAGLAMGLLIWRPEILRVGFGHPWLPPFTHLLTLGVLLGSAYPLLEQRWVALYGTDSPRRRLLTLALVCQLGGVLIMVAGLMIHNPEMVYWGGHYFVPTAVGLLVAHGVLAVRRRGPGLNRHLWSHLPVAGLLVAVGLGALLVMDALTGDYGIYNARTIVVHLLSGGFLFVLPLFTQEMLKPGERERRAGPATQSLLRYYLPAFTAGAGVMLVAAGMLEDGPAGIKIWLGLAVAGLCALWLGLPLVPGELWGALRGLPAPDSPADSPADSPDEIRPPQALSAQALPAQSLPPLSRLGWLLSGLALLFTAVRVARGAPPQEYFLLGNTAAMVFLFLLALPEAVRLLCGLPGRGCDRLVRLQPFMLGVGVLFIAGHLSAQFSGAEALTEALVRLGAIGWLTLLGLLLF